MKKERENKPIHFALIIFIIIAVFSVGQLTWWIIFQIKVNRVHKQLQLDKRNQEIEYLAHHINRDFQSYVDIAALIQKNLNDSILEMKGFYDKLLDNPVVAGYLITADSGRTVIQEGVIDSTFYAMVTSQAQLFFNPLYPEKIINTHKAELTFQAQGYNSGQDKPWVNTEMFQIATKVAERLDRDSRRHIVMFVSEGSFFMLIIMFGAFLIYRTLQRSEDLKFRQQNFIQAVTHEFRTPLTSMRLYLQTLISGKVNPEKTGELYPKMLDDCDRLERMVDNILQAGLYDKNDYKLNLTETDLGSDINEYLDNLEPLIKRHNGVLRRDIKSDLMVKTDFQALGRALTALVDNALKYSPSENRKVEVSLDKNGACAVLSVADNGIGIPYHEQQRIFERFYRLGNEMTRTIKGTGLGLYLVRQIVEAHNGTVEVASNGSGEGSVFTIKLPLVNG